MRQRASHIPPGRPARDIVKEMSDVAASRSERRRQRACDAALAVAADLGIHAQTSTILQDWNNTIIRLDPAAIVAKVGTSHFRDVALESLERELTVARHLAARNAPIVRPAEHVPAGPHRSRGLTLTLWQYVEAVRGGAPRPLDTATAIKVVHKALTDFDGQLPCFTAELNDAEELLQPHRSPALSPADRRFLLGVVRELKLALPTGSELQWRPLHGSPHDANWLQAPTGPLLLDFETACQGPVEWDLAALVDEALALFPSVDRDLIRTLRRMRSVCVAAKCWVAPERAPELRDAAHVHLKLLRRHKLD
jgi:Ser/Thr protein kinase RdoA (MazF antagonist)